MRYDTIREATEAWVREFNAIQISMIDKLMQYEPYSWREVTVFDEDADRYMERLPMWGTMWSFGDRLDDWWLEEKGGIEAMSRCGFRIYESDEHGFFFGIDGAGYDFYEAHWIPLYKERGLQWHKDETDGGK